MQQKSLVVLMCFLWGISGVAVAEDLLSDEQGPTSSEAVATVTANEDFLLPSYAIPVANATPQTTAIPSEVDILNEIFGSDNPTASAPPAVGTQHSFPSSQTFFPRTGVQIGQELLTPLPPLPVIQNEEIIPAKEVYFKRLGYADQALAMATTSGTGVGMPREIKISFYHNQTSFSAQALKWVKSFAIRVVNDPTLLAEIRVSEQDPKIQEKRLRILLQILKETGVSVHQIRLYQTNRNPDSILMGYVNNPDYTTLKGDGNSKKQEQKTINW